MRHNIRTGTAVAGSQGRGADSDESGSVILSLFFASPDLPSCEIEVRPAALTHFGEGSQLENRLKGKNGQTKLVMQSGYHCLP
jgi:hypothetical protein